MGRLKRFFKHKFVIVSLCFILVGALALTIMSFIPKAKTYTNKDTVEYEHMGEKVTYRLTFADDKNYYIDYVNEQGKVVQEKAISGTYEIKDGVLYNALGEWGEISVYGIDVKFAGVLDAGYECKPAKYARLASIAFIVLGGLMFVLAAYVGITKKKTKVAVAPAPKSAPARESYIKRDIRVSKAGSGGHNPLARKLPRPSRPTQMQSQVESAQQPTIVQSQVNNIPQQPIVQPQVNNMQTYQAPSEPIERVPVQTYSDETVNTYKPEPEVQTNHVEYVERETFNPIFEEEGDAYDDLVHAIEEDVAFEEEYNKNIAHNEPYINIQKPEGNIYLNDDFDPMEMDIDDKKDDEN